MKPNLKEILKIIDEELYKIDINKVYSAEDIGTPLTTVKEKLGDFGKQLRKIKANLDKLDASFTVMSVADFQRLINEILGDELRGGKWKRCR